MSVFPAFSLDIKVPEPETTTWHDDVADTGMERRDGDGNLDLLLGNWIWASTQEENPNRDDPCDSVIESDLSSDDPGQLPLQPEWTSLKRRVVGVTQDESPCGPLGKTAVMVMPIASAALLNRWKKP